MSLNKTIKEFNNESTVQNVIIDDIASLASNKLSDYVFATSLKSANIIYGIEDYERPTNYLKYITQQSKTFILMKMETGEIPNDLKIKIMDNLEDFPPFYKAKHLRFQYPGEAMVFGDNNDYLEKKTTLNYKKGYTFSSLKLVYEPVKGSGNNYYLNKNSM